MLQRLLLMLRIRIVETHEASESARVHTHTPTHVKLMAAKQSKSCGSESAQIWLLLVLSL